MTILPALRSPVPLVMPLPDVATDVTVGAVVSICGLPWVRPLSDRLAALPAPSCDRGTVEVDRRHHQVGGVLTSRHRVAEGQRIGARAADIGGGADVVERQRRRAAGRVDRHVLAHGERQRDGFAGAKVAARGCVHNRRDPGTVVTGAGVMEKLRREPTAGCILRHRRARCRRLFGAESVVGGQRYWLPPAG